MAKCCSCALWWRQFGLILLKNFVLQVRRPIGTVFELLLPVVAILLVVVLRLTTLSPDERCFSVFQSDSLTLESVNGSLKVVYFTPNTSGNWLTFLNERAPPLVFVLLAVGPTLSGLQLTEGFVDVEKFLWAAIGLWCLLITVRVMDDVKDYELDVKIHPERPLPRGLIAYDEVVLVIQMMLGCLLGYALMMGMRFGAAVGWFFAFVVVYAVLMYVEFGIGEWLEARPFLYACTHQVCIYFCGMFICVLAGQPWYSLQGVMLGTLALSGFFTYEVCRKLDPTLPLIKGTYLVVYGPVKTFLIVSVLVLMGAVSSYLLELHYVLWPLQGFMLGSLAVLFLLPQPTDKTVKPKAHKAVEALSAMFVLAHLWIGYFIDLYTKAH